MYFIICTQICIIMSENNTNLIKKASELNNKGAYLIVQGEHVRATTAFQTALALMKRASTPFGPRDPDNQEGIDAIDHSHSFHALRGQFDSKTDFEQDYENIYRIPFVIEENITPDDYLFLPLFSAVILFNLGLCCHEEALMGKESYLRRASRIYRMCLQLLENVSQHCPSAAVVAVVAVAALNNKAEIHFDLCEYMESKECRVVISRLFASTQVDTYAAMETNALECIFRNALMVDLPSAAKAA